MTDHVDTQPRKSFWRGFVDHPASVNETYFEHMRFAGTFALTLFGAGLAALIHAIIPPLFETTASRNNKKLHARMEARH
ncbi:unnamed protein product [Ectocarpus sp. 12 AP-2014]